MGKVALGKNGVQEGMELGSAFLRCLSVSFDSVSGSIGT